MTKSTTTYRFDNDDAKGVITVEAVSNGLNFTVTSPDGTEYKGALDLFHFSNQSEENCFQVFVEPVADDEKETFHVRFYPNGRIDTFNE